MSDIIIDNLFHCDDIGSFIVQSIILMFLWFAQVVHEVSNPPTGDNFS